MKESLIQTAKDYVELIERIEKTRDPRKVQDLEEKRVELHWLLMDMFIKEGIQFKDRDHVTRIAMQIAKGEL